MVGKKVVLSAIGAATVAAGGAAAYWYTGQGGAAGPEAIAKLVPDDALMAAFVSTDPQAWEKLQQFGTPEMQQAAAQQLETLQQEMLSDTKIDLKQDLSWAGDTMIAILPAAADNNNPDPDLLMVVGIQDKMAALRFAQKLEGQPGVETEEQDYKGVKIKGTTQDETTTYIAVLGDYLVVSPDRPAVERSIDTHQGAPSLAAQSADLLKQDLDLPDPLARFYVPAYPEVMQELLASNSSLPLPPTALDQLQQVESLVGGIGVDPAGIRIKAQTNLDPKAALALKPASGEIVAQFPTDTLALVSGTGIDQYWSQLVQQANSTSEAQLLVGGMRQMAKSQLQLDLDREVFGWMDGEFALGLLPAKQGFLAQTGFGSAIVLDTSNRKQAEATLQKLDQLAESYSLKVSQRQVKNQPVTEWAVPGQGALLGHGWLDQDSLFVTIDSSLSDVLVNKPGKSLPESESFKALTTAMPKQNLGYVYVNLEQMMPVFNQLQLVSQSDQSAQASEMDMVLGSMRGVAMTWTQPSQTSTQMDLLLSLKSAQP